jgi:ferredoxin-NADP reductase
MWNWQTATLERIERESPTTKRFFLRINADAFSFRAGQFITLDLPIDAKRMQRWRSYSIASAPDGSNLIELCIVRLDGGLGTAYLFDTLKIGDTLTFKGADGTFTLPETLPKKIVMLATGTGIAPFRSMIFDENINLLNNTDVHLIFGTRNATGILYEDEWAELTETNPNFRFSVALSRENDVDLAKINDFYKNNDKITINSGYVHPICTENFDATAHYYLCGWKNMIDEAVLNLKNLGLPEKQLHYELYG